MGEIKKRSQLPNVSYFVFTAMPKPKTLELFDSKQADGRFAPFNLYTMRQAIEEGFDDPRYDRHRAAYLLKSFVDLHPHMIEKKVAIMVDHCASQVIHRIGGKAKAMIVTRSRLHPVRYLQEKGHGFKALVGFSGTIRDGGAAYTEANMNSFPETPTAETFKRDEYRILIVAYKFQTGFDQPLRYTMYVDKHLAVSTPCRGSPG